VRHRLGLATKTQISVCKSPFPSAGTAVSLFRAKTVQQRPLLLDVLSPPLLRLTSRKPLWLDLQPVDIKRRRRHNWKSAQVVNSHLVCDPTIWQPGFDLPRQQWSLLLHCGPCRYHEHHRYSRSHSVPPPTQSTS